MKQVFRLLIACATLVSGAFFAQSAQALDRVFAPMKVIDVRAPHDGRNLTMEEAIYRGVGYSRAPYYFFDADGNQLSAPASEPRLRPVGSNGNLSIFDSETGELILIAESEEDGIVYGETVSRNEFGIDGGVFISPDNSKVAFYRKDERGVTLFPLLDIGSRTGTLRQIRYPMNGMQSEIISLGVFDMQTRSTVYLDVQDFGEDRYITNVTWSPDSRFIYAQILDRSQHHMKLNQYSASSGAFIKTLLTEDNDAWIEPLDPIYFLKGRCDLFIYRTDNRDGFRNLYLADTLGTLRRLTAVDADVEYIGNDGTNVFYTSAEVSPVENHLFRISLRIPRKAALKKVKFGKPVALTPERGWHRILMNDECTWFADYYSNLNVPTHVLKRSCDGRTSELLFAGEDPLEAYSSCKVEMGTVRSADGLYENYYRLVYPKDFDPSESYPVIVYVYGGPHSQLVQDSWLANIRMWEMLMAERGYFVYIQDNRGTQNRGAAYEKAINRHCGQAEMEDQMAGLRALMTYPYIDQERIGVHGWSYGGFMTISLMLNYPEVFKVGVAGGPVIDWKWYEVMYGERYMDTADSNPEGFRQTSLVYKASRLEGDLLICQGAVDNTVVWEHSLSFIQACIDELVQVDYFPYPVAEHNVMGINRVHLMEKVTRYFEEHLK